MQLQKLVFSAITFKPLEERAYDFLTNLQRLVLESFPDLAARAASGGRPVVVAASCSCARHVRESFLQEMPIKRRRSLVKLPEEPIVDEICAKAASRITLERFYPEDDDSAFNELSSTSVSSKELSIGMQALSLAHDTPKQQANNFSDQIQQPYTNLQISLNFITQQSNQWLNQ